MILSDLTLYLAEQKRVALMDISYHFDTDPEALRMMLSMLERKGRVRKLPAGTPCGGGCCNCDPASIEIYEWVNATDGASA
jgi:DNA-binding IscR family transcriptional regulator